MYDPTARATDPAYLRYQYADSEKLRIRADTHRLYSERPNDWQAWVIARLDARPGHLLLDAGSGPGLYHPALAGLSVAIIGLDYSFGMVAEARAQATHDQIAVQVVQGDTQALPFRDACFDRVMANHMLYHVPDQLAALREVRRVTRPGGRVVMATVAGDQNARLIELHAAAAAELGLKSTGTAVSRFTLDHLDLVRQVFPEAQVDVRHDAFVFRETEPVLRYYASGMVFAVDRPASAEAGHHARLIDDMRARIAAVIAAEGAFRVPKDAGAFVAQL